VLVVTTILTLPAAPATTVSFALTLNCANAKSVKSSGVTFFCTPAVPAVELKFAGSSVQVPVTPTDETMNAWQLVKSPDEPESANRNLNYLNSLSMSLIEWPLLTSTTACFLLADKSDMGAKGLRLEVKELPTMKRVMNPVTGNFQYQFRMVLFPGSVDYMGMQSIGL